MIRTAMALAVALAASPAGAIDVLNGAVGFTSGEARISLGEYFDDASGSKRVEVRLDESVQIRIERYYVEFVYVYFLDSGELDYSNDFTYSSADDSGASLRNFTRAFIIPSDRTFISGD